MVSYGENSYGENFYGENSYGENSYSENSYGENSASRRSVFSKVVSYGLGGHYEPHHDYFGSMTNYHPDNSKVMPVLILQFC